jgi:hypothetical protein
VQRREKTFVSKSEYEHSLHNWLSPYLYIIITIWRQGKDVTENAASSAKVQAIRNLHKKIKIEGFFCNLTQGI